VEGSEVAAGRGAAREEPVARAEQLFASLTEEAEQRRQSARFLPAPPPRAAAVTEAEALLPTEPRPLTSGEVYDLLLHARAATERIAKAVKTVRSQANATAADQIVLGEAVELALSGINDRLAALELDLLGRIGPAAVPAERALARLRRMLQQASGADPGERLQ